MNWKLKEFEQASRVKINSNKKRSTQVFAKFKVQNFLVRLFKLVLKIGRYNHGEAGRMREEVVRPRVEDYDADAGVADMLNDYHEAQFVEGRTEDEPEATAKAFYDMFAAAQKPLHDRTKVSQLDAIGRVMAFKSQYSLSRDAFDGMLIVIGSLLPEGHILPKTMYEAQKLLRALKMPYEQIHAWPKGCVLFRK